MENMEICRLTTTTTTTLYTILYIYIKKRRPLQKLKVPYVPYARNISIKIIRFIYMYVYTN